MAEDLLHKKQFPPYTPKKGEEYMSAKQLAHFHAILTSLKDELSEDIERTVHTMQDEATVFADPNDRRPFSSVSSTLTLTWPSLR
jgi:DnaK suppressor protein